MKTSGKYLKYSLYSFLALVVLLIVAVPLIPADSYRAEIETRISTALQVDVSLGEINLTSLPQPGLVVKDIKLTDAGKPVVSIDELYIVLRLSSLFSGTPEIRRVKLTGVRLNRREIGRFMDDSDAGEENQSTDIAVRRIDCEQCYVSIDKQREFGPFEFKLLLEDGMQLASFKLSLEEQAFKLSVTPEKDDYTVSINAKDWRLPLNPKLEISSLQVEGLLRNLNRFHAKTIKAIAYEGKISGNLIVDLGEKWTVDSRLKIESLNLAGLLREFDNTSIDGTAAGEFNIRSAAISPAQLGDNLRITGEARVSNGHLYNTDLESVVRTFSRDWNKGGQTPFDQFKTQVDMTSERIKLSKLSVTSSTLDAAGYLNIRNQKNLNGEINVELNDTAGLISMPLAVTGTVNEPKIRPTKSALAGGAVGTALLGPGVGTAAGIKAGKFFDKVGNFFSSDDDEKKNQKTKPPSGDTLEDDSE